MNFYFAIKSHQYRCRLSIPKFSNYGKIDNSVKLFEAKMSRLTIYILISFFFTAYAQAYIGPGAGIGAILTALGFILLIYFIIVGLSKIFNSFFEG